jgi:hypothetical protein
VTPPPVRARAPLAAALALAAALPAASRAARAQAAPVTKDRPASPAPAAAGDAAVLARVRTEGMERSRVLQTATVLSDVFGPRLAGSAGYAAAAEWARATLAGYGLRARLEPWGVRRGNRWTLAGHSLELTAPYYARLVAYPFAWSPATGGAAGGAVRGTPVLVTEALRSAGDVARVADRVRGRIVLLGEVPALADAERLAARGRRWAAAELDSLARLTDPGSPKDYWDDAGGYAENVARRQAVYVRWRAPGRSPCSRRAATRWRRWWRLPGLRHRPAPGAAAMTVSRDDYARLANLVRHAAAAGRGAPEVALEVRARLDAPRTRADSTASTWWPSCRAATRGSRPRW